MILGVDAGQSALKTVLFDDDGHEITVSRRSTGVQRPHAGWAERDMVSLADQLDSSIAQALADAGIAGRDVSAVGLVAHGDGIYPVDVEGRPTRTAILALDQRASGVMASWRAMGVLEEAVALTGQLPHTGSQAPVLAWWQDHEPETLERTRWLLYCKDWLRAHLTGTYATDTVEANACLGSLDGSTYDHRALAVYGLGGQLGRLPDAHPPTEIVGTVTAVAARRSGLRAGTPVVTGTHDVVGSALGSGASSPGDYCVQAGTYSVNQLIDIHRTVDPRWQCRPWVSPGLWVAMGASPSSASNLDWFVTAVLRGDDAPLETVNAEVASILDDDSAVVYHPFLHGSPHGSGAAAALLGLRAEHSRGHVLRAVFEGVAFNHRFHLDALAERAPRQRVHLSGGASHSPVWCQIFADVLGCQVAVTDATEHGALGGAMLAGIGSGLYSSLDQAVARCVRQDRVYSPDSARVARYDERYEFYLRSVDALSVLWQPALDGPSARPTDGVLR